MSKAEYLRAVERALREDVLAVTTEAVARDSLCSCINILAALRCALDGSASYDVPGVELTELPQPLRAMFETGAGAAEVPAGLADDLAVRRATISRLKAGQSWIEANTDAEGRQGVVQLLLAWERAQRGPALAQLVAAAAPPDAVSKTGVRDLEQGALQEYFTKRFGPGTTITNFRRIMGGRSRQTALFSQQGANGLPADLVVQRDPPVYTGVPGVEVQAPVMAAAHAAGMRAPKPWFVEKSREPLGAPFMIVDRLPGRPIINATTEYFAPPPQGLQTVARSLARQMAILHTMPVEPLESVLRCSFDRRTGTWADEIVRLKSRLGELVSGPSIALSAGMSWLERHVGNIQPRWSIIHTDMLLHNLLMQDGELTGVLDWEIAHIGHPGEDLGYVRPVIEQIMPWSDFMAAYADAGGTPLSRAESDFFSVYAAIRLLTLVQTPRQLFERGATNDLRLAETAAAFIPQQVDRIDSVLRLVLAAGQGA